MILLISALLKAIYATDERRNYCINVPGYAPTCPNAVNSYAVCYARKIPIGPGASSEQAFTSLTKIVLPGDKIMCVVHCRTSRNETVENKFCNSNFYTVSSQFGTIEPNRDYRENSSYSFFYIASGQWEKFKQSGGKDRIDIKLNGKFDETPIKSGIHDVFYPPLPGKKSKLECSTAFVKPGSTVNCKIIPQSESNQVVRAAPGEFDVKMSASKNIELGNFSRGSFLAISSETQADGKELIFQYEGANKSGCNLIQAAISTNLPNYADKGAQIYGSPFRVCTVVPKGNEIEGLTTYAFPFVLIAIVHVISTKM